MIYSSVIENLLFLIILVATTLVFLAIFIPIVAVRGYYKKFVNKHSVALRQLKEVNKKYKFIKIPNFDMSHSYDNENFYGDISCRDYLTYQLVYSQKKVSQAMRDTLQNKDLYDKYKQDVQNSCAKGQYDTEKLPRNAKRLKKFEDKIFKDTMHSPVTNFSIYVKLILTNINGDRKGYKDKFFYSKEIKEIIHDLNNKKGSYYANENIWNSICRVERGKVTNKMRFAIYERDGWRCRKCGRRRDDLEVDHIIPIARAENQHLIIYKRSVIDAMLKRAQT